MWTQKWIFTGDSWQFISRYLVSVGPSYKYFSRSGQISSIERVVEKSVEQPSIIFQPSADSLLYLLRVGQHLGIWKFVNCGQQTCTPIDDRNRPIVDWSIGRFRQIGWWTTVYHLPSIAYRSICAGHADGTMFENFFDQ